MAFASPPLAKNDWRVITIGSTTMACGVWRNVGLLFSGRLVAFAA
jgi:hypothetical protein